MKWVMKVANQMLLLPLMAGRPTMIFDTDIAFLPYVRIGTDNASDGSRHKWLPNLQNLQKVRTEVLFFTKNCNERIIAVPAEMAHVELIAGGPMDA